MPIGTEDLSAELLSFTSHFRAGEITHHGKLVATYDEKGTLEEEKLAMT